MSSSGGAASPRRPSSNLRLRVLSGIVLVAVALLLTWLGGSWFALFSAAIGAAVLLEWFTITRPRAALAHQVIAALLFAGLLIALFVGSLSAPMIAGALVLCALAGLAFGAWVWTSVGLAYALAAALPLALLRGESGTGLALTVLLFATVWATDIVAYFVGRALGGPKLAPAISPGKTWSGAIGGIAGGVSLGLLAAWLMDLPLSLRLGGLLVILSAASQAGDLFESWVKRRFGAKDSGTIIPGHGGVMDRVDGLVAAALVLYLIQAVEPGRGGLPV